MNRFQLRYETTEDQITLRPFIDGQDLLAGFNNDHGRDPDDLLPPLSTQLFPTREGRTAIVGMCSCGETGCGALAIRIRRVRSEVVWEATESPGYETLHRSYSFDLTDYLDAVDDAADDPPPGEGQGRRVARAVRVLLGLHDQKYSTVTLFHQAKVDWISAWPWTSDVVKVSVSLIDGQTVHEFSSHPGETEAKFAARVAADLQRMRLPSSPA
jgi:hypothetical protein